MPLTVLSVVVNGNVSVSAGTGFDVIVTLSGVVSQDTGVSIATTAGEALGNTTTGTILLGTNSVDINFTSLTVARTGVIIRATQTSGDAFTAGNSAAFTVLAGAPSRADTTAVTTPQATRGFSVRVDSTDGFDNLIAVSQNTTVNLTLGAGAGVLSGNLTGIILSGAISTTISNVVYDTAEAGVTLIATSSAGDTIGPSGVHNAFTVSAAPAAGAVIGWVSSERDLISKRG